MKKGFTLIELLAVIVILAIIALIATPIILGIIEDARKGSIEASANGYIDAVEYKIARDEIKGSETSSGVYDVTNLDVDLDGSKPTSGTLTIEKGKITEANLCIDGYNVEYKNNKPKVLGACNSLYKEDLLNGADPQLKDELVPVVITDNGIVTKADTTKEWYNYEDKKWANAVILFGKDNYKAGDPIAESDIKEYYVWIPKYAYKLWNVNSDNLDNVEKPIEIVFGLKAKTTGEENGDMYLHPAFTNFDTQGIWVGKFETSYNEETYIDKDLFLTKNINIDSALINDPNEIIIKPNVRSLAYKNVSEFHTLIFNSHRNLDSHMMTNMEWGATTYLTYSVYGRCDSSSCTEVTNNNVHTGYLGYSPLFPDQWERGTTITGCAADNIGDSRNSIRDLIKLNTYETSKGVLASTTGNITGIYDMSGGNWEYVMGVLVQPDGKIFTGRHSNWNSGFKGIYGCPTCDGNASGISENAEGINFPNSKYYNTYINTNSLSTDKWYDYSSGLLGDATKEIANIKDNGSRGDRGNWYNDYAYFVTPSGPWFSRGGSWNVESGTGLYHFSRSNGSFDTYNSARAVLAF